MDHYGPYAESLGALPDSGDATEAAALALALRIWGARIGLPARTFSLIGLGAHEVLSGNATPAVNGTGTNTTGLSIADGGKAENPMPFPLYVAFLFMAFTVIVFG